MAAGIWWMTCLCGIWVIGRVARINRQLTFAHLPALYRVVHTPAVILHEMAHVLVSVIFGHRVVEVCLRGAWNPTEPAFIVTAYNPLSFWHRLGSMLAAWAPILVPVLLAGGCLHQAAIHGTASGWALAFYVLLICTNAMDLSAADWEAAIEGAMIFGLLICFILGLTYPPQTPLLEWPLMEWSIRILGLILFIKTSFTLLLLIWLPGFTAIAPEQAPAPPGTERSN